MSLEDFTQGNLQKSVAPNPDIIPTYPDINATKPKAPDNGETFLTNKGTFKEHPILKPLEEAFEFTTIPTFVRKVQGEVHAIKEGDPELARKEALGVAGVALLNTIPVEKIFGLIGRGALKFLPEGTADALKSVGAWGQAIKDTASRFIGAPMGNFINSHFWNPLRRIASTTFKVNPDELSAFEKQGFQDHRNFLQKAFNDLEKSNPQAAEELKPIMQASGNTYVNKVTDPYSKPLRLFDIATGKVPEESEKAPTPKKYTIDMAPHPLQEEKDLGLPTDNEQMANIHAETLLQAFRDQMDIKGSTGFASPKEAEELLTSKINAMRNIEPAVQNLMKYINEQGAKVGIKNFADLARLYSEEPSKIKELPEGLRYYPIIFRRLYDMAHDLATQHGFEMGYWENYANRLVKQIGGTPEDLKNGARRLSSFVKHTNERHFELPLSKLKGIQDGTITSAQEAGLKGTDAEKEFTALKEYLFNKDIDLSSANSMTAYLQAFARAEMARSVENILHSAQINPDVEFIRMGMTYPEWSATKELIKKASSQIYNKEGNGPLYENLKKMDSLLNTYVPGENHGLPGGNMYHPDAIRAIGPLLQPSKIDNYLNNYLNAIRMLKSLKLGGFPGSLFHAFNQTQAYMASGQGFDMLFAPKVIKTFNNPQVQRVINKFQTWGLNVIRNNEDIQDVYQMGNKAIEDSGGPQVKKWVDFLHNNAITNYTFRVQGPADQYLLMNANLAKAKVLMPHSSTDAIGHMSAYITNFQISSLRPEIMSNIAKYTGNYFLLARNFTFRNIGLILNSMDQWFVKTPTALGILPPEFRKLFTGGLNAIQNMENMLPEEQEYVRKELADFLGTALAQRMWRLQFMSYLASGHSTFANEQGHELDIDTGLAEWKKSASGRYTFHKIYLNNLGFLHDAFNMPPITPPIEMYNTTKNPWVFANPINYIDLSKTTTALKNKTNAFMTLAFDLASPKRAGETRLEANTKVVKDVFSQAMPIPVETLLRNWDSVTFKYGWDTALEMLAIGVLGAPRVLQGASPNVAKTYKTKQAKGALQQIKEGWSLP